ncbi:MAG: tyrosine-protein phosphatase [Myxococcales bacterium]|nr:tyrosine-protein phosphatase [Myxococcales bacterium]MCB9629231.1 tyrosine-protein phosphatase [Sandaracinaceae bacterium]
MTANPALLDLNLRDLGGLPVEGGREVRRGLVFRAGALSKLTPTARAAVDGLGLRTLVDLRTPYERERYGPTYTPAGAQLVLLSIDSGDLTKELASAIRGGRFEDLPLDLLSQINRAFVQSAYPQLGVLMRLVADERRRPLLFHCSAGKDRTGLVAALLLSALGASWPTVLDDYLRSNETPHANNLAYRAQLARAAPWLTRRPWRTPNTEPVLRLLSVDADYLRAAWDEMTRSHASVEGYLAERLGLAEATRLALQEALLTTPCR